MKAKKIAIVSYNEKKKELIEWSYFNRHILNKHEITATFNTGTILEGTLDTEVQKVASGPAGGYQQLIAMAKEKKFDVILFFGDPLKPNKEHTAIKRLLQTAVNHNIVTASNRATIDLIMGSILTGKKRVVHAQAKTESFVHKIPAILLRLTSAVAARN